MLLRNWTSQLFQQLAILIFALFVATGAAHASATVAAGAAAASAAASSVMQSGHEHQADQQIQKIDSSVESVIGVDKRSQKDKPKYTSDRAWRLLTGFLAFLIFLFSILWDEGRSTFWVGIVWSIALVLLVVFGSETLVQYAAFGTVNFIFLGPVVLAVFFWFYEKLTKNSRQQADDRRLSQSRKTDSLAAENSELRLKNNELQEKLSCSETERKKLAAKLDALKAGYVRTRERAKTLESLNKSLVVSNEKLGNALSKSHVLNKELTKLRDEFYEYALTNDRLNPQSDGSETDANSRQEVAELLQASGCLQTVAETVRCGDIFREEGKRLRERCKTLRADNMALERRNAALQARLSEGMHIADSKLQQLQNTIREQQETNSVQLAEIKALKKEVKELTRQRDLYIRNRHRSFGKDLCKRQQQEKLQDSNEKLTDENRKLRYKMTKKGIAELDWKITRLEADLANAHKEISTLRSENRKLIDKLEDKDKKAKLVRFLATRTQRGTVSLPRLADVFSGIGAVPNEDDPKLWETSIGRVKLEGRSFYSLDHPGKSGSGALELVARVMNVSRWEAILILKESLGIGPALGAVQEAVGAAKSKWPDIAPQHAIECRNAD